MCKENLALNNFQGVICYKTQLKPNTPEISPLNSVEMFDPLFLVLLRSYDK